MKISSTPSRIIYYITGEDLKANLENGISMTNGPLITDRNVYFVAISVNRDWVKSCMRQVFPDDSYTTHEVTITEPGKPPADFTFFRVSYDRLGAATARGEHPGDRATFHEAGIVTKKIPTIAGAKHLMTRQAIQGLQFRPGATSDRPATATSR